MPVTINEFEVVTDPPAAAEPATSGDNAQAKGQRGATPHEIEAILRREKERLARVRAD